MKSFFFRTPEYLGVEGDHGAVQKEVEEDLPQAEDGLENSGIKIRDG